MSAPASAPSVKMGRIPELLSFIAFFMDNATLASMARVSTVASTPALRMLWSEMDAFGPLLRLLDPALYDPRFLESRKAHYNQFTSFTDIIADVPEEQWRWDRFRSYATLVRSFSFDEDAEIGITSRFWTKLCSATNAPRPLLPSVSRLCWLPTKHYHQDYLPRLILFIHPELRDLVLLVAKDIMGTMAFDDVLHAYAQMVLRHCPDLVHLELQVAEPARVPQPVIIDLLRGLPRLETVSLPAYWGTAPVLAELSSKTTVKSVDAMVTMESGWGVAADVMNMQLSLTAKPFRGLTHLGLCLSFDDWLSLLRQLTGPPLEYIFVQPPESFQTLPKLSSFLEGLSTYQAALPELALELRDTRLMPFMSPRVGIQELVMLHRLRELQHFELYTGLPLQLTNEELDTLLSGLPKLTTLQLNAQPLDEQEHPAYLTGRDPGLLTLEALNVVRQNCPDMAVLGLYTGFWDIDDYIPEDRELRAPPKLVEYHMGTSALREDQAEAVAALFFDSLPHLCQLEWGYYFPEHTDMVNWGRLQERYATACVAVGHILNVSRKLVRRETDKHQRKIHQLELRIQELESRPAVIDGDSMVL